MISSARKKPDGYFYLGWVAAGSISLPIAWIITLAVMSLIVNIVGSTIQVGGQTHITEDYLGFYILSPLIGLLSGLFQYAVLHDYFPRMRWWVAATFLGWLLPFVIFPYIFNFLAPILPPASIGSMALVVVLLGSSIGLFQWIVLRRQVRRAAWWILASIVGLGLPALAVGASISGTPDVLAVILLPPVITCLAWRWLLVDRLAAAESAAGHL